MVWKQNRTEFYIDVDSSDNAVRFFFFKWKTKTQKGKQKKQVNRKESKGLESRSDLQLIIARNNLLHKYEKEGLYLEECFVLQG